MEKFPSLQKFYTHAVTDVTDNYQVCQGEVKQIVTIADEGGGGETPKFGWRNMWTAPKQTCQQDQEKTAEEEQVVRQEGKSKEEQIENYTVKFDLWSEAGL